jgi:hypothetical protein
MRIYDIYVAGMTFLEVLLLLLFQSFQWWRFLKGKVDAIALDSFFIVLFGGMALSPILPTILYSPSGFMDGGCLLALPEFFVFLLLLVWPFRLLNGWIFRRMPHSQEQIQNLVETEAVGKALLSRSFF